MTWRKVSAEHIGRIIREHPRNEGEPDRQYRQRIYKALRDRYPFAQKSGFAYQCWLEERARILYELGITDQPPKKKLPRNKKNEQSRKLHWKDNSTFLKIWLDMAKTGQGFN